MTMTTAAPPVGLGPSAGDRLGALLCLASSGHEYAFSMVYDAVSPRLYGLALRTVGDPDLAEEITRQTFVEVWRHSASFDPGGPVAPGRNGFDSPDAVTWMTAIARDVALRCVCDARAAG